MAVAVSSSLDEVNAMKPVGRLFIVLVLIPAIGGCGDPSPQTAGGPDNTPPGAADIERVRGMAAAGLFYPRHKDDLAKAVDACLRDADPQPLENIRGLVCPHAGYEYSGLTAAFGYKLLAGQDIRTVVVMAPSHTAIFDGASIPEVDAYETPLGLIPLSPRAAELGKIPPFVVNPPCKVQRPPRERWAHAPGELPPFGEETPHSFEHSIEVELPFLQRTLNDFQLVPVVFGNPSTPDEIAVDPEEVAAILLEHIDDNTLLVASSDLSHYHSYETANGLDATCCEAICSLNTDWMRRQEACGKAPILTLMHIARKKGWKATLLDYRNSGDATGNTSGEVVGYAAIAFCAPGPTSAAEQTPQQRELPKLAPQERQILLALARRTIAGIVADQGDLQISIKDLSERLTKPGACFVTLNKNGELRGCIGDIFPRRPLFQAVVYSAAAAAVNDQRFPPVRPDELDQIEIEISLLSLPTPLEFDSPEELLARLRPEIDGVVLCLGQKEATYLPQVWEQIPQKQQFLGQLAEKAGLDQSAWKDPKVRILTYQAEVFHEQ